MTLLLLALGCARSFHDARSFSCSANGDPVFEAPGPIEFRDAGTTATGCAIRATSATFPNRNGNRFSKLNAVELFGVNAYTLNWAPNTEVIDGTSISIGWSPSDSDEDTDRGSDTGEDTDPGTDAAPEVVRITAPREGWGRLDWNATPPSLTLTCSSCTVEVHGIAHAEVTLMGPTSFGTLCSVDAGKVRVQEGLAIIDSSPTITIIEQGRGRVVRTPSTTAPRPLACLR